MHFCPVAKTYSTDFAFQMGRRPGKRPLRSGEHVPDQDSIDHVWVHHHRHYRHHPANLKANLPATMILTAKSQGFLRMFPLSTSRTFASLCLIHIGIKCIIQH